MTFKQTVSEKVAETALAYYRLTDSLIPTAQEVINWLESLLPSIQTEMVQLDYQQAILLPSFKRYLLESRGNSMPAYMAAHLTPEELPYWVDDNDGGVRPA